MSEFQRLAAAWEGTADSFIAHISREAGDRLWDTGMHDAKRIAFLILPECQAAIAAWNYIYETQHTLKAVGYTRITE